MAYLTQCVRGGSQNSRPGYLIKFDYDQDIVERLKKNVPHIDREWRPLCSTWWISEDYEPILDTMFGNFKALSSQRLLFEV